MQRGSSNSGLLKAFTAFRLGFVRARPVHKESASSQGLFHVMSRGKQSYSLAESQGHSSTGGSREGQDMQAACSNDNGDRDVWQNYLKSYAIRHYMTLSPENIDDQDFKKEPAAPCSPVQHKSPSRGLLNVPGTYQQGYSHKTVQGIRQAHQNSAKDDIEAHKEQQELEAETEAEMEMEAETEAGTNDDADKAESLLELPNIRMVPCRYQMTLAIDRTSPEEEAGEEDQFQMQPILSSEKNVDLTADVDENPYTISQTLEGAPDDEFDDVEAKQDMEQKEAREPETEPEPEAEIEPFQQQQPMGHSTLRVTASRDGSDGKERPLPDSDRRFKEKASAEEAEAEAEDEGDDSGPRDSRASMEPTDEFIRTDLQRHKEREYEGIYWNGKGERYDSRLDIAEGEETGYVTGKGTPLPRPEPQPIPLVPEKK